MEEKIQPTIKETIASMMMSLEDQQQQPNQPSRKNSMTKSLSQVSIISSLLNEEEKRFLGGGGASTAAKNQSNLYSTPADSHNKTMMSQKVQPDTPMSLSPELKPLSINTISPEPESTTKELSKSASNLLREQEKNLLHLPNTTPLPPASVAGTHRTIGAQKPPLQQRFSAIVWLGGVQLVLSIVLVALGGLVIARGASLAGCCAGVWTGAIAGLAGAFGIMGGIKRAQTAFLACSLICVASSTLALALTGIGAVRDSNLAQQDETKWNAVSGGTGLIIILIIHFIVSMVSVYHSALKLCSGQKSQSMLITENSDHSTLSKNNIEEYIQSIATDPNLRGMLYHNLLQRNAILNQQNEKANSTLKQGSERMGSQRSASVRNQPILLVPAGLPPPMMYHQPQGPPPPMFHPTLMPPGYVPTSPEPTHFLSQQDLEYLYRSNRSLHGGHQNQVMMDYDPQREEERKQRKWEKRQRREQERQAAFTYTGLDRTIAEDFLEQQEKSGKTSESMSSSVTSTSSSEEEFQRNRRYGDVAM